MGNNFYYEDLCLPQLLVITVQRNMSKTHDPRRIKNYLRTFTRTRNFF